MTKYMGNKDYKELLRLRDIFDDCLVGCAQEISMIEKGRLLEGDWDCNIDFWDDKYLVAFESAGCCDDIDTDSVYVPIEFIYDEGYREYYRKVLITNKERDRQRAIDREEQKKAITYRIVTDERAEYERLKSKFEGD